MKDKLLRLGIGLLFIAIIVFACQKEFIPIIPTEIDEIAEAQSWYE